MRFKLYKPTDIPSELLCAVIMLAALFGNLSPRMGLLGNCIGLFFAAIVMLDCVKEKRIRLIVWILFAGSLVLGVYNVMFVGQHAFQKYVITGVTFFAVGLYFNVAETLDYRLWRFVFVVSMAFIMFNWLRSPDGYTLFYQQGRNYVSIFLLVYLMPMVAAAEKNHITIWIGYYVLIVLCTISAVGRGGIVCAMALLAAVAVYRLLIDERLSVRQKFLNISLCGVMAVAGGIVLFRYWDRIAGRFLSRFVQDNTGSDNSRLKILTGYIDSVDSWPKLLLGSNSRDIPYLAQWLGNIHNSYLMTHAAYGLIGAAVLIVGLVASVVLLIRSGRIELGILIAVIAARGAIDTIFMAKPGDAVAWFCMIYTFAKIFSTRKVYFFVNKGLERGEEGATLQAIHARRSGPQAEG